jgi:hypothetical protein
MSNKFKQSVSEDKYEYNFIFEATCGCPSGPVVIVITELLLYMGLAPNPGCPYTIQFCW